MNDPPVTVTDRVGMNEGDSLTLDVWELLKNDTDPENDALNVTAVGSALNGWVLLDETTVTYEHDGSETISGGFEYTVTDGSARNTGQVHIDVKTGQRFSYNTCHWTVYWSLFGNNRRGDFVQKKEIHRRRVTGQGATPASVCAFSEKTTILTAKR